MTVDNMPELSKHNNWMATVIRDNPKLYEKYIDVVTPSGFTFEQAIQTGVDNPGKDIKDLKKLLGEN